MNITAAALDRHVVTSVTLVVLAIAGVMAYQSMPRSEDPGFIIRTALVQTVFPGASPERVELLVTDKLERVIQEMPELDSVQSTSKVGVSVIYVNIKESYTDLRPIWDRLRRKVDGVRSSLPEGVIGPNVNDEFGDVFGTLIGLTGEGFSYRELLEVAEEVRNQLLLIPDVAKVDIFGTQEERVFAEFDNERLSQFGLSPLQLQQLLQSRNIVMPGGDISTDLEKLVLEPTGNFETVEELRRTVINLPGRREVVRLEDLVDIYRGYIDPPSTLMHTNGIDSLGLAVSLREGGNILALGERVSAVTSRMQQIYPIGIEFENLLLQADIVAQKTDEFIGNLLQAVVIVALVMLAFLGLRTGLIVASLIPMTMLAAFFVMDQFAIGIDQMSLASLIIALGMLVDNAIVMSESIMVSMAAGVERREAAIQSANELKVPLLVSSLTTAAAFLPIYLAESSTGEYTAPLFKVVTITLLCSWLMALTLIPLLCVMFLKVKQQSQDFQGRFYRGYRSILLIMVRNAHLTLLATAVVFAAAVMSLRFVPNIFFPANDRPTFTIDFELPSGTPIQRTRAVVSATEDFIRQELMADIAEDGRVVRHGVVNWGAFIGAGAPKFMLSYNPEPTAENYGLLLANATSTEAIGEMLIPQLQKYLNASFPDLKPTVRLLPMGAPAWPPVSIRISGSDSERLFAIVEEVKRKLASVPGTRLISDDWGARTKKIIVDIDDTRARLAGVSHQDIALSLQTYLTGLETTEFREGDKLIPVVLRSQSDERTDPAKLAAMNVYAQSTGQSVPLAQVAAPRLAWEPGRISRRNRVRTVAVESLIAPRITAAEINAAMAPWLNEQAQAWPQGFSWEFGGEAETSGKANASIAAKLPVAGLIILLLLVGQFNSIRLPAIILITIPLGFIGVIAGLLIANSYFGFMTLLGIISLSGIVINNAIVLLDRIRIEIEDSGLAPAEAVIEAAQQRLRPILLTTATTVGGLIPLWLGGGPMWEPMAISIIFGLLVATVLTLGIVPVLYTVFFRVQH